MDPQKKGYPKAEFVAAIIRLPSIPDLPI